jgi:hypothetical protein
MKCCQAAEEAMSGWYVRGCPMSTLPDPHDLVGFAREIGLYDLLADDRRQLLSNLAAFRAVAAVPKEREAFASALDHGHCLRLLKGIEKLAAWLNGPDARAAP